MNKSFDHFSHIVYLLLIVVHQGQVDGSDQLPHGASDGHGVRPVVDDQVKLGRLGRVLEVHPQSHRPRLVRADVRDGRELVQ